MEPQGEKLNALDLFSQKLLTEGHYESVAIASRRDAVLQRLVYVHPSHLFAHPPNTLFDISGNDKKGLL